jgi:chromosome segregation ATPase
MDPVQLKKMTETLGEDVRALKHQLETINAEKERLAREKAVRDEEFERLNKAMTMVKEEKKRNFSEVVQTDVKPFFERLKKDQDPRLVENMAIVEDQISNGLEDAFMKPNDMALFQTVRAANSALTATSQELERMFKSERDWTEKFNALQKEKMEYEVRARESNKAAEEAQALKEKTIEDLKGELAKLKAVHSKNLAAVENHFDTEDATKNTPPPETGTDTTPKPSVNDAAPTTVRAEASNRNSSFYGGFETLFEFKPNAGWRNNRRDDGF